MERGTPHGRNLYGYRRVYDPTTRALLSIEPDPDEAPVVVEVIDRILAGESVRSVTLDLNSRGVTTSTGATWHPVSVRRLAMNPSYAGLRTYKGEVVGKAAWPGLVSEDRHRAVVARLSDPARQKTRPGGQRHLLSGTSRCGVCGGPLRLVLDRKRKVYSCSTVGCFKVAVGYDDLNEYVSEAVVARLGREDVQNALRAADSTGEYKKAQDEIEALRGRLSEVSEALAAGTLPVSVAGPAAKRIEAEIAEAEGRLRASVADPLVADVAGPDARSRWGGLSDEQRATLVRLVVEPVVGRSTRPRGSHGFDPDRVRLDWLV